MNVDIRIALWKRSTSADAATSLLLSPSEFERYYLLLSQSLNDLERQLEQHRLEQYLIFDRLTDAGLMKPHSGSVRQQKTRRYRYHPYTGPAYVSSSRLNPSPFDNHYPPFNIEVQYRGRSRNHSQSFCNGELGTKENPIYVSEWDHDKV